MSDSIKCPYCVDGSNISDPECCGEPIAMECCGEPIYSQIKCDVCHGTDIITKQYYMELKLKGIQPDPSDELEDFVSEFTDDIQQEAAEFSRYNY